jgi:hypothetical protein
MKKGISFFIVICLLSLQGCGGGSDSTTTPTPAPDPVTSNLFGGVITRAGAITDPLVYSSGTTTTLGFSAQPIYSASITLPTGTVSFFPQGTMFSGANTNAQFILFGFLGNATTAPSIRSVFALYSDLFGVKGAYYSINYSVVSGNSGTGSPIIIWDVNINSINSGTTTYQYVNYSATGVGKFSNSIPLTAKNTEFYILFDSTTGNVSSVVNLGRAVKSFITTENNHTVIHGDIVSIYNQNGEQVPFSSTRSAKFNSTTAEFIP